MAETADLPDEHELKVLPDYVLPRHYAWMGRPEKERRWTQEALQYAGEVMAGTYIHERQSRFSPSGIGSACSRETLFSFGGWPKQPFPLLNQEKMDSGVLDHLRWQMEGLSAGYMTHGETWVFFEGLRMGGSADARLDDGSLFELKNTGDHLYKAALELQRPPSQRRRPQDLRGIPLEYFTGMHLKHLLQIEAYLELDRLAAAENGTDRMFTDYASLVYQATTSKECTEFRIKSSPVRVALLHTYIGELLEYVDSNTLPEMLDGCDRHVFGAAVGKAATEKEITVFKRCPYRDTCPQAATVTVR